MLLTLIVQVASGSLSPWPIRLLDGQPFVTLPISGVPVELLVDTLSSQTAVVPCSGGQTSNCYVASSDVKICAENAWTPTDDDPTHGMCFPTGGYSCSDAYLDSLDGVQPKFTSTIFDGLVFLYAAWEVKEHMGFYGIMSPLKVLQHIPEVVAVPGKSLRDSWPHFSSPAYFSSSFAGIFGIAPASVSCRKSSYWDTFVTTSGVAVFTLDFAFPSNAWFFAESQPSNSSISFEVNARWKDKVLYSEERQSGDALSNGRYGFLLFLPQVCGVDLLHNVSSNWFSVIDTRSRCLVLPPFLWDAVIAWLGKMVECAQTRGAMCRVMVAPEKLPSFSFALANFDDAPRIDLPLEQLVIKDGSQLYLCVARAEDSQVDNSTTADCPDSDGEPQFHSTPPNADMTAQHIGFGSLVVSALYTVIDLGGKKVGFALKHVRTSNSSEQHVVARRTDGLAIAYNTACPESTQVLCGPQQTYFPPLNKCLDPVCDHFMFLALDPDTHTCMWAPGVGLILITIVVVLVIGEIVNERLYARVLEKARCLSEG